MGKGVSVLKTIEKLSKKETIAQWQEMKKKGNERKIVAFGKYITT